MVSLLVFTLLWSVSGQNQLFVSTPFSSKKLGGDNLYFITQDIEDPKIFYGTTGKAKADGHCIKRLNLAADTVEKWAGTCGTKGFKDSGDGHQALFDSPRGLCQRPNGDIIVIDAGNALLRSVNRSGFVTTFGGKLRESGRDDGPLDEATFSTGSCDILCTADGNMLLTDTADHSVRLIMGEDSLPAELQTAEALVKVDV